LSSFSRWRVADLVQSGIATNATEMHDILRPLEQGLGNRFMIAFWRTWN